MGWGWTGWAASLGRRLTLSSLLGGSLAASVPLAGLALASLVGLAPLVGLALLVGVAPLDGLVALARALLGALLGALLPLFLLLFLLLLFLLLPVSAGAPALL